jgi:hypothetical protein
MINTLGNIFVMNAHPFVVFTISFLLFFAPMFWFFVLPIEKAKRLGLNTLILGSVLVTFCFFN